MSKLCCDRTIEGQLAVTFVTQWFAPEPVGLPVWIANCLTQRGIFVRILSGVPNFPTGVVHEGYSAWTWRTETTNGFYVSRTPLFPSHDASALRRAVNYLSWAVSSTVLGGLTFCDADVSLVYSSPATAALPAMWQRLRRGKPYVLMIMDVWPDSVLSTGMIYDHRIKRIAAFVLTRFVSLTYRGASSIVVSSPGMIDLLTDRGVPRQKLSLVYNWVDESLIAPREPDPTIRRELGLHDKFVLMYAGNHGAAQNLTDLICAFGIADVPDVHLVFVGEGVEKPKLRKQADSVAPGRVHFLSGVPMAEIAAVMATADVQVVSLRGDPLFSRTMPSKVQAILACAKPIIVVASGDARRVVEIAGAGWGVVPGDVAGLARMIRHARATRRDTLLAMGCAGQRYYARVMGESASGDQLVKAIRSAAGDRRDRFTRLRRVASRFHVG